MPHHEFEKPRKSFTPNDLLAVYMREQKPLAGEVLFHLLEPLAGSSFFSIAIQGLRKHFAGKRIASLPPLVLPLDLYVLFFKQIDDTNIDNNLIGQAREAAESAFQTHGIHNIGIDLIYPDSRLQPGEMAFHQMRHDLVYFDEAHTQPAFIHSVAEWTFFKDGSLLTTIPIQRIYFTDAANKAHMPTVIVEGYHDLLFFHDRRQPGIAAFSSQLQEYKNHSRMLFVSEKFDFSLAAKRSNNRDFTEENKESE